MSRPMGRRRHYARPDRDFYLDAERLSPLMEQLRIGKNHQLSGDNFLGEADNKFWTYTGGFAGGKGNSRNIPDHVANRGR